MMAPLASTAANRRRDLLALLHRSTRDLVLASLPLVLLLTVHLAEPHGDNAARPEVHVMLPGSVRFFEVQREAMKVAGEKEGLQLFFWNAEWNPATQLDQIRRAVEKGADVIAVAAVDTEVLSRASAIVGDTATLVTFTNGTGLEPPWTGEDVAVHIGRDEHRSGELLGAQAMAVAEEDSRVLSIEGSDGTTPQKLRFAGLSDALTRGQLSITGRLLVDDWNLALLSRQLPAAIESSAPDIVAVQWADAAVLVSNYLTTHGITDVTVVALEWTDALRDEMHDGFVASSTYFSVSSEGVTTIETIARLLDGAPVQHFVEIDQRIVTAGEADQVDAEW